MPSIFPPALFDRRLNIFLLITVFILTLIYLFPLPLPLLHPTTSLTTREQPRWLIATISPALSQRRRNIIRTTWQSLYTGPPADFRFILANPGIEWYDVITAENNTHGDLIMLDHLTEGKALGMMTKEIDFALWLVESGRQYNFVSKLDDDSYLDGNAFYDEYLSHRVEQGLQPTVEESVIIGRHMGRDGFISEQYPFPYPGGQFWTMSWPVISALARQYNTSSTRAHWADVLIGKLLDEAGTEFNFVDMPHSEAFEYREDIDDEEEWEHVITSKSMNPHLLKEDELYLKVAGQMRSVGARRKWWKDERKWEWTTERDDGKRR